MSSGCALFSHGPCLAGVVLRTVGRFMHFSILEIGSLVNLLPYQKNKSVSWKGSSKIRPKGFFS